jgi:hypothetical protein
MPVARHEARERLVDDVLLDVRPGPPATAVDAEQDGRFVLAALEVDVQRSECLGARQLLEGPRLVSQ